MEDALDLLEGRITRLGTGYTHYWYISAALSLVQSTIMPNKLTTQKQQAVERVALQYQRILELQEDFMKAKEKLFPVHDTHVRKDSGYLFCKLLLTFDRQTPQTISYSCPIIRQALLGSHFWTQTFQMYEILATFSLIIS